jgi:F-type H+-transporting ATPase subunit b
MGTMFDRISIRQAARSGLVALAGMAAPAACAAAEAAHDVPLSEDLPLWGLVTFIGFVWVLKKLGWEPLVGGMAERERKENEAIARAEDENRRSQQDLTDRKGELEAIDETTREFIDEAHRDAQRTRGDIVTSARNEAESLNRRALREIERTRDQSLKGLFDAMAMRVVERTQQRLAESLTPEDQQRLMDESLAEFTAVSNR